MHFKAPDNSLHFIDSLEHVHLLPSGSIQITDEEAEALRPKPDAATLREAKLAAVRATREAILNRLAGIALAAGLTGDDATTQAYVAVRAGLLDITSGLSADPAAIDAEVVARYAAIVAQCTPSMVSAFAQVDA